MKEINVNGFEEIVAGSTAEVAAIARAARELIVEVMPDVTEVAWVRQKIIGYGVGPKKMSEQFCYIAPYKGRINLGFYYGVDLDDPAGLFEGSGVNLRHIKISKLETMARPEIRALVEAASTHLPNLKK